MFQSPFTASRWQVTTYLFGVALFSISFLVFLNSSMSFVITDLIGRKQRVGDAVGTLGFADELVALVACPFWGLLSDRIGVRNVCVLGYTVVGLSLLILVQARNVFPQLLLARLFFSVGGAATSTMVTAVLPTMTMRTRRTTHASLRQSDETEVDQTLQTPQILETNVSRIPTGTYPSNTVRSSFVYPSATSQIAGFVGMFTGLGALIALSVFLPLPARLQKGGNPPATAIAYSYYIVSAVAFMVSIACFFGLRALPGEDGKVLQVMIGKSKTTDIDPRSSVSTFSYRKLLLKAAKLGYQDQNIGLGYLGGFVARASSVGITSFIPLFVNAYFISSGLCDGDPNSNPSGIKDHCRRAYIVASMLSGVSQLVALLCAPIIGYLDGRYPRFNTPLLASAVAGVLGYISLARLQNPDPGSETGSPVVFAIMALVGISQIGAIVCSLSLLSRGIQQENSTSTVGSMLHSPEDVFANSSNGLSGDEISPLLTPPASEVDDIACSRSHLKGSIAGLYSLAGGAGILLLTKLGGVLFDTISHGAPFYMTAIFNAILLFAGAASTARSETLLRRRKISTL